MKFKVLKDHNNIFGKKVNVGNTIEYTLIEVVLNCAIIEQLIVNELLSKPEELDFKYETIVSRQANDKMKEIIDGVDFRKKFRPALQAFIDDQKNKGNCKELLEKVEGIKDTRQKRSNFEKKIINNIK